MVARVSTFDQNVELQRNALDRAGCERVHEDNISCVSSERPGWMQAHNALRHGDALVVGSLDRLGRSLKRLIETVNDLDARGVGFKSLAESIDTTTSGGRLVFHIFGALAEFERELIRERTQAGLAAARARGRMGGRPQKLSKQQMATAHTLLKEREHKVTGVAEMLGVSRSTLYRALDQGGGEEGSS